MTTNTKTYQAAYRAAHRQKAREASARWRLKNPDYLARDTGARARSLKWARKNLPAPSRPCPDCCESCGKPPRGRALALDHCHESGAFRGWLCFHCNTAIGMLGDNAAGVSAALKYLEKFT